jgi:hypothetical protein
MHPVARQPVLHRSLVRLGVVLILLSLVLPAPVAAHLDGAFWPAAKVLVAVDGARARVGARVIRVDADTTLCSGEGRTKFRRGVRTWMHFRCTFTTFSPSGPGRDVEFRVHALDAQRMLITNTRWIFG